MKKTTNKDERVSKNTFVKLTKKDQKEITGGWASRSTGSQGGSFW